VIELLVFLHSQNWNPTGYLLNSKASGPQDPDFKAGSFLPWGRKCFREVKGRGTDSPLETGARRIWKNVISYNYVLLLYYYLAIYIIFIYQFQYKVIKNSICVIIFKYCFNNLKKCDIISLNIIKLYVYLHKHHLFYVYLNK